MLVCAQWERSGYTGDLSSLKRQLIVGNTRLHLGVLYRLCSAWTHVRVIAALTSMSKEKDLTLWNTLARHAITIWLLTWMSIVTLLLFVSAVCCGIGFVSITHNCGAKEVWISV